MDKTIIEVQEYEGHKMLCLNAGAKFEFKFGAPKARVLLDNKQNISDFYDICMKGLSIKDKSINDSLRMKLKMKGSSTGEYMILDLTPENNKSGKPFEITKYRAGLVLDRFTAIYNFVNNDDLDKASYANQKWQEELDEKNKRGKYRPCKLKKGY